MRLSLLLMCLLFMGCKSHSPKLSERDVLTIATNAATKHGYDVERYESKRPEYNFVRKDRTWTVFFELPQPQPPGGHFLVWIEDATGNAQVMPGE